MKLSEIYKQKKLVLSFEVFPPKTAEGIDNLCLELDKLRKFKPDFISVTYGAGGTSQDRSLKVLERLIAEQKYDILPHLTCIGSSQESILGFLEILKSWKIDKIMALRGDHPWNNPDYHPKSNFFKYASDLVSFTKKNSDLEIAVAGYPVTHFEAASQDADIDHLKQKVDAGAVVVITQLFFDNNQFFKFRDVAVKKGIKIPIVPGIMPITARTQLQKIPELCGNQRIIPEQLAAKIQNAKDEQEIKQIGFEQAVEQIEGLKRAGIPGLHLYPLNKAEAVSKILDTLI